MGGQVGRGDSLLLRWAGVSQGHREDWGATGHFSQTPLPPPTYTVKAAASGMLSWGGRPLGSLGRALQGGGDSTDLGGSKGQKKLKGFRKQKRREEAPGPSQGVAPDHSPSAGGRCSHGEIRYSHRR